MILASSAAAAGSGKTRRKFEQIEAMRNEPHN